MSGDLSGVEISIIIEDESTEDLTPKDAFWK